jgi:hypothetical protein
VEGYFAFDSTVTLVLGRFDPPELLQLAQLFGIRRRQVVGLREV